MVDVVDVVLAGALGAALLAIALLYTGYRRNRALIQELRAELRACALTSFHGAANDSQPPGPEARGQCPLRRAARWFLPRRLRRRPPELDAPASPRTGTVGVQDNEEMTKEPYGARTIQSPAPPPDDDGMCDDSHEPPERRGGGDGGVIKRGPLTLLR